MELFARKQGQLEGMTANECIAELHSNDDFFGTVSWQVHDALTWHRLSPNDVPTFLLGAWVYVKYRTYVRIPMEQIGHWKTVGSFEFKEHIVSMGMLGPLRFNR